MPRPSPSNLHSRANIPSISRHPLKYLIEIQAFLNGLIGHIKTYHPDIAEQLTKQVQEGGRIVLPGQFPLGGSALSERHDHPHIHPHSAHHR